MGWRGSPFWQIYKCFRNSYIGLGGIFLSFRLETQSICILLTMACIPCFHKVFYFPETLSTALWSVVMEIPVPESPALTFTDKDDVSMQAPLKEFSYLGPWDRVPLYRLGLILCNQTLTSLRTKKLFFYISGIQFLMSMWVFIQFLCGDVQKNSWLVFKDMACNNVANLLKNVPVCSFCFYGDKLLQLISVLFISKANFFLALQRGKHSGIMLNSIGGQSIS